MRTKLWSKNLKGKDHSEKTKRRWEDNIRMDVTEIGRETVDWIHLSQGRELLAR